MNALKREAYAHELDRKLMNSAPLVETSYIMPITEWRIMFAMSKEAVLQKQAPLLVTLRVDRDAVESGLAVSVLTEFLSASGMQCRDIYEVVISARTLKQRMKRTQRSPWMKVIVS